MNIIPLTVTIATANNCSERKRVRSTRGHWGIEGKLHWVRDVTYDEDRHQARTGNAPRARASLRNLAIVVCA